MKFKLGQLVEYKGYIFPIVGHYYNGESAALLVEGNKEFMKLHPFVHFYNRESDHHKVWNYDPKYIGKAVFCTIYSDMKPYNKKRCDICHSK